MHEWKIDKHIPIAVIMAMVMQTFAIIWWAAQMEARVNVLETQTAQNTLVIDRVSRVEEKVSALRESNQRIEQKIDQMIR